MGAKGGQPKTEYVPFTEDQAKYMQVGGYRPKNPDGSYSNLENGYIPDGTRQVLGRMLPRNPITYVYQGQQGYDVEANPYYKGVNSLPQSPQSQFVAYGNAPTVQPGQTIAAPSNYEYGKNYGQGRMRDTGQNLQEWMKGNG